MLHDKVITKVQRAFHIYISELKQTLLLRKLYECLGLVLGNFGSCWHYHKYGMKKEAL